jgi:hypothetical protein
MAARLPVANAGPSQSPGDRQLEDRTSPQAIPWKRISVEAGAIVASILLAFAIDAWWLERQERGFEQETMAALLDEFLDHRSEPAIRERIFNDPEFLTILEIRHGFLSHTIGEIEDLIDATDSIIEKI